jgi:antitoxin component of MazEF toxin-antitoxin module
VFSIQCSGIDHEHNPQKNKVDDYPQSKYCNYMNANTLKIARIGNSRGVRLPAVTLRRYRFGDTVVMEERSDGILLRSPSSAVAKISWADTARAMSAEGEDWHAWDHTSADGNLHEPGVGRH